MTYFHTTDIAEAPPQEEALVMDLVRKHGMPAPFRTFGSDTVLMLGT